MPDATVIDALVVTLGLDPSKFGSGAQAAQKKLVSFNKAVKDLGADETKLTDKQRKRVQALREQEVQSARTTKEITASERATKSLFSTMEKVGAGFGAYLGVSALKSMAVEAIHTGAAISRMSTTLGISVDKADTWGKAISATVNGSAESVLGAMRNINNMTYGAINGGVAVLAPLLEARAKLARYSSGPMPLLGPNNRPLPPDEILLSMADPAKAMGAPLAHANLDGLLGEDVVNFLLMGRKADEAALKKAAPDAITPKQADDDKKLEQETNNLINAFDKLKNNIVGIFAPGLITLLKSATAEIRYQRGDITKEQYDKDMRDAHSSADDPDGRKWEADRREAKITQGAQDALPMVKDPSTKAPPGARVPPMFRYGAPIPPDPVTWTQDQKLARLQQLIRGGQTPEQAAAAVTNEMAGGHAPPPPASTQPGSGAGPMRGIDSGTLDAIRRVESGGNAHAVSAKGALGAYQMMPATARQYGVTDPFNEAQERKGAEAYLNDHLRRYQGSLAKTLAAYNWGPSNLDNDIAKHGDAWRSFLPAETAAYIPRVIGSTAATRLASAGDGGITNTFNGDIIVNSSGRDGHTIGRDIKHELVAQADSGPH